MRAIEVPSKLGRLLSQMRAVKGVTAPCRLRLQDIERIEKEFRCTLPDPCLAYVAAGVSAWGRGATSLLRARELTLSVREMLDEDAGEDAPAVAFGLRKLVVIDDDANGNYIAVSTRSKRSSDDVLFLDHEGWDLIETTLSRALEQALEDSGADAVSVDAMLAIEVYDEPDPEPEVTWVTHKKYGRGQVLGVAGDVVTVRFEDGTEKSFKQSFLQYE